VLGEGSGRGAPGTFVLTSVADTGHGMAPETQQHLFEPFFTTRGLANAEWHGLAFDLYLPTRAGA